MEPALKHSAKLCPFLRKTSPSTLRALSTSTSVSASGGAMSNLRIVAERCPIMSQAMAVQSVGRGSTMNSALRRSSNAMFGLQQKRSYVVPSKPSAFGTTGITSAKAADVSEVHRRAGVVDTSKGTSPLFLSPGFSAVHRLGLESMG